MKGILHENRVSERGTSTSILEYARALRRFEAMEIALAFRRTESHSADVLRLWRSEFETIEYSDATDLARQAASFDADFLYAQKSGSPDGTLVRGLRLLVHAVFQDYQPHGHAYAYVSEWLADAVKRNWRLRMRFELDPRRPGGLIHINRPAIWSHEFPVPSAPRSFQYVPLIVRAVDPQDDLRRRLRIPDDAFVVGSLSASSQFDVPFVRAWVEDFLCQNELHYFLGPNLSPFIDHPRAIFLPTLVGDVAKADYLFAIDAMLHARLMGETFGLALCEALKAGTPVMSWSGGRDRNHVRILSTSGWMFKDGEELNAVVRRLKASQGSHEEEARALVCHFEPAAVAARFRAVFGV